MLSAKKEREKGEEKETGLQKSVLTKFYKSLLSVVVPVPSRQFIFTLKNLNGFFALLLPYFMLFDGLIKDFCMSFEI